VGSGTKDGKASWAGGQEPGRFYEENPGSLRAGQVAYSNRPRSTDFHRSCESPAQKPLDAREDDSVARLLHC
jgi:hypothetical protein